MVSEQQKEIGMYFGSQAEPAVYSWNQKLTLEITPNDGRSYTHSSVVKVTWTETVVQINDAKWKGSITGEMPHVRLGEETIVVALFGNRLNSIVSKALFAEGVDRPSLVDRQKLSSVADSSMLANEFCLGDKRMPYVVVIPDTNSPTDISLFDQDSVCLSVEKTDEPVTTPGSLDRALPWLIDLGIVRSRAVPSSFFTAQLNSTGVPIMHTLLRDDLIRD